MRVLESHTSAGGRTDRAQTDRPFARRQRRAPTAPHAGAFHFGSVAVLARVRRPAPLAAPARAAVPIQRDVIRNERPGTDFPHYDTNIEKYVRILEQVQRAPALSGNPALPAAKPRGEVLTLDRSGSSLDS